MHNFTKSFKAISFTGAFLLASVAGFAQQSDTSAAKKTDTTVVVKNKSKSGIYATGTILDAATGKPLSGINVSVFEYSAAITDDKGSFSIEVPSYLDVLLISAQGYQTKEVPLKGRKSVSALLYEDGYTSVYNVAKLPFGSQALNTVSNAVTTINVQGAWETSNETPDTYLQGKVVGLNAIRRSGTPLEGADLFLRGYSSLYATNKPLIVVDGMIYDNAHYGNSLVGGHFNNPLSHIAMNDIDNITVIKDGTSMYGTKGANGVVLISTGHTNDLATKIDFGAYSGYNFKPTNIPVMQAGDFRVYLSEMLKSSGLTDAQIQAKPYMNDNVNSGTYYAYHNNTNWQNQVFHNSFNQDYYLRVSGGDNIAKYTLSMGYGNNGSITDNTNVNKYNTRFNADLRLTPKLSLDANLSFDYNEQNMFNQGVSPKTNPIFLAQVKSPFLRLHQVNAAGAESPNLEGLDIFAVGNPVTIIDTAKEVAKSYRFAGSVNFKYQFNKYINLQTLLGVTYDKVRESYFVPRSGTQPDTLGNPYIIGSTNAIAYSRLGSQVQRLYSLTEDTHLNYDRVFGRIHHVVVNIGSRLISGESQDDYARSYNSPTDQFLSVGTGNTGISTGGELGDWLWWNNYLGVDYSLKNKYFLSYNMGIDASSRFGSQIPGALSIGGLDYAVLPSVSAGWLISSEPFMANINFITLLKLRASFGLSGNDDIGNYAARQYYVSQNFLSAEGLVRGNIGNPQLQWETVKKANIGLDVSLLKERLGLSFDIYQNTTSHMLINEPAYAASGFTYVVANDGGMQTQGIELSANGRIINGTKWKWDAGFNISKYRNKVTQIPNGSMTTSYAGATVLTQVGSPANLFYGYKTNGVYRTDDEAASSGIKEAQANGNLLQPHGGDVRFVDVNHDGVIDSKDAQVIGNPNPDFTGAISSTLTYKRISLSALFTFSKGNQIFNYVRQQLEAESGFQNQTLAVLNRWRVNGQVTDVPKATYGDPIANSRFSDRWIEDGSYLRLRTLSVVYNVPIKQRALKSIKIYATGNNLFTLTKYLGYDPEFSATESVFTQGIDTGLEPLFKSVQLGVRIGL
ncbi:SusC/RagA family TonB-linked outer membrane protein [Mucilaginibacter sp. PPCGB 2223]|uniref:SusC/RagA family TonB-linked outer membrane protein n=1 Tax=Mucilaginibacter sp. PPCGB 2223 TaxID=1886027 RepID=UPI000825640C|nr:SusC/RagA family TonB-linked outer membrane protein [Mucilaginibacter sp. PPCGB 2223]OCX51697.1 SusC/RagA family TonB-linked outer membrane protein [Mucilaginibacter sp. PPCGB 2223]